MQNHCCIDTNLRISFPGTYRKVMMMLCIIIANTGCINYYKVNSTKEVNAADHKSLVDTSKQVIVHLKDSSYALRNVSIYNNALTGNLVALSDREVKYLHPSSKYRNRYKRIDASIVFNEVHVYAEGVEMPDNRQVSIPMNTVSKVDVYEKNKGASIGSHVLGAGLVLLSILVVAAVIVAATFTLSLGG